MTRRQFMRGTDPIKSTWVYPNLIPVICYNNVITTKYKFFVFIRLFFNSV